MNRNHNYKPAGRTFNDKLTQPGSKPKPVRTFKHGQITSSISAPSAPSAPPAASPTNPTPPVPPPTPTIPGVDPVPTATYQPPPESMGLSSYKPEPGKDDPRDETYWKSVIALQGSRNANNREQDIAQTASDNAYSQAVQNLAIQKPRDELALKENANRAGAFYSSKTGESVGQLAQQYFNQNTALSDNRTREESLRQLTRDKLAQGYTVDEAAALAEAVDRHSAAEAAKNPPLGDNPTTAPYDIGDLLSQLGLGGNATGGNNTSSSSSAKSSKQTKGHKPSGKSSKKNRKK